MDTFSALADPTRRDIVEMIANNGEMPATEIYGKFSVSHPAISQHLKVLRETGLVRVERRAQQRIYRLNAKPMIEIEKWVKRMTQVWEERFEALEEVLNQEKRILKNKNSGKHGRNR